MIANSWNFEGSFKVFSGNHSNDQQEVNGNAIHCTG
jgi:hypothetical protein